VTPEEGSSTNPEEAILKKKEPNSGANLGKKKTSQKAKKVKRERKDTHIAQRHSKKCPENADFEKKKAKSEGPTPTNGHQAIRLMKQCLPPKRVPRGGKVRDISLFTFLPTRLTSFSSEGGEKNEVFAIQKEQKRKRQERPKKQSQCHCAGEREKTAFNGLTGRGKKEQRE